MRAAFSEQNKTKLVILLAIIEIALLVLSIPYYKLNGDEAWSAEDSYFMSRKGYSTSNLFSGYIMEDVRVVAQHKLLVYLGAALFGVFHYDLWIFRLIPVCSFILVMIFFVRYQRKYLLPMVESSSGSARAEADQHRTETLQIFLSVAIVLAAHEFFYFAKIARPEMLVALLGFLSFYFLQKYLGRGEFLLIAAAGFLAGLAMLAHLNGVIFAATGFVWLLLRKKFSASCVFCIAALVAFLPYILDVYWHYEIFKIQINSDPNKTHFTLLKPFKNLAREHERLFRKPEIIIPSVLFLFHLVVGRKKLFTGKIKELTIYTLLLMVFLGLVVEDKTIKYSTYLIPFWGILIARSITTMETKNKVVSWTNAVLLSLLFVTGVYWQAASVFEKENYPPLNREIAGEIPLHSTCIAPMNFIFNEIADYKIFSDYLVGYERFGENIDVKSLSDCCRKNRCEYVVFNRYGESWEYIHDYRDTVKLLKNFEVVDANNDFVVLKCKSDSSNGPTNGNKLANKATVQHYISYMQHRAMADGKLTDLR